VSCAGEEGGECCRGGQKRVWQLGGGTRFGSGGEEGAHGEILRAAITIAAMRRTRKISYKNQCRERRKGSKGVKRSNDKSDDGINTRVFRKNSRRLYKLSGCAEMTNMVTGLGRGFRPKGAARL